MDLRKLLPVFVACVLGCGAQEELKPDIAKTIKPPAIQPGAPIEGSDLDKLADLERIQRQARTAYDALPDDKEAKAKFIKATNAMALHLMYVESIPQRERYPLALKLYREVIRADPKNTEALKWIGTIEDIYRSLKRPIPKV